MLFETYLSEVYGHNSLAAWPFTEFTRLYTGHPHLLCLYKLVQAVYNSLTLARLVLWGLYKSHWAWESMCVDRGLVEKQFRAAMQLTFVIPCTMS